MDNFPKAQILFLSLFVLSVLAATSAVLADVESIWIVFLVFHCRVIALFAVITSQCDDHAIVFLSHGSFSVWFACPWALELQGHSSLCRLKFPRTKKAPREALKRSISNDGKTCQPSRRI